MIPTRIKVSGFLCYRDEQEVAFDGSALWMLSGLNGSGKSSMFDAMTYALFGYHRGGAQGAVELINKNENGFAVEFDFRLDGQLYRLKRTLKRRAAGVAATQQVLRWQAADGAGQWLPVTDTQRKVEFDAWVREHIGLNYETFTASVLLLQGRAEKLLDSTAKGRAEVLASIVDLERYQKLHERADTERKSLRGRVETLQHQLNALPEVSDFELAAAAGRIEAAQSRAAAAHQEVERRQGLELQARQWAEVQRRLAAAQARRGEAARLIQEADGIERQLRRLRELRDVLPHVETIVQRRADLARSEDVTKLLAQQLRELELQQGDIEHETSQVRRRRAALAARIAEDERRQAELAARLPELAAALERVRQFEQRRDELGKLEADLAAFPADLPAQIGEAQKRLEDLSGWERALSPLARFAESRRALGAACRSTAEAQTAEGAVAARGAELRQEHDALRPTVEAAQVALREVENKLASEQALFQQAAALCAEFDQLDGAKVCRTCGQELTPAHHRAEKARRDRSRNEAEARVGQAQQDLEGARASHAGLAERFRTLDLRIQSARDDYRDARNQLQQAQKEVARLTSECQCVYAELAEPYQKLVADSLPVDWTATTFPTAADLEEARAAVRGISGLRRELEHAREAVLRRNGLTRQIEAAQQALNDLAASVPGDPAGVRREFAGLEADGRALAEQIKASRQNERTDQARLDGLAEELARLRESITDRQGRLQTEETTRRLCQQALATSRKALPAPWQEQADRAALAELNRLRGERDELERAGVEARAEQLGAARIEMESLRLTLAGLEAEREQFPAEARRDPAEVRGELAAAQAEYSARMDEQNAARLERSALEARARQRADVRGQLAEAEKEHQRYKVLAELLGRDRLQRHLVRQAERQIVDCANGVLDRLSGGTLMLRLAAGQDGVPADQALELEAYNRATGQEPINIAFLSGSQRFRVAVSLALGIGQYASRLHRPIESVIIDEGFGCLDRFGRQVMIQELQNLRGHLHCILLVSHQEEFAEAFADGYRFELTDGATRVTRRQR